jgi:hypothetical protein
MAIFFLAVQTIQRSAGRSAVACLCYRLGVRARDDRTGQVFDYRRRGGVADIGVIGWDGTPGELANACEMAERKKNAVVAREIVWALPHELGKSASERRAMVTEFAGWLRERHGVAIAWAIHLPPAGGDARQYHAHLLITTRRVTGGAFGEKTRELDIMATGRQHIESWRQEAGEILNRSLSRCGIVQRVDHRSHARQAQASGFPELLPQVKVGQAATRLERKGVTTVLGMENRRRAEFNEPALRWRADARAVVDFVKTVVANDEPSELPHRVRHEMTRY